MKVENAIQGTEFYGVGIPFQEGWSLDDIKKITRGRYEFWLDTVYDYKYINEQTKWILQSKKGYEGLALEQIPDLDPFLWEEFTGKLEEARQFVFESYLAYGINKPESHFLSVKFAESTISKFRLQLFIEFGGKDTKRDFEATHLRNAINILWHRFLQMKVYDQYLFSKEAASEEMVEFRKQAAIETSRVIIEETGAILHAKLIM